MCKMLLWKLSNLFFGIALLGRQGKGFLMTRSPDAQKGQENLRKLRMKEQGLKTQLWFLVWGLQHSSQWALPGASRGLKLSSFLAGRKKTVFAECLCVSPPLSVLPQCPVFPRRRISAEACSQLPYIQVLLRKLQPPHSTDCSERNGFLLLPFCVNLSTDSKWSNNKRSFPYPPNSTQPPQSPGVKECFCVEFWQWPVYKLKILNFPGPKAKTSTEATTTNRPLEFLEVCPVS